MKELSDEQKCNMREEIRLLVSEDAFAVKPRHVYILCLFADVWHALDTETGAGIDDMCTECYEHWILGV